MKTFPVSEYQKRFWLEWILHPKSHVYNTALVYKIEGKIDELAIKESCNLFTQKFDVLHIFFNEDGSKQYHGQFEIDQFFEKITLSPENIENSILELVNKPFNLLLGPLFRLYLIKTEEDVHYFIMSSHHIIIDAKSTEIFSYEIENFYNFITNKYNSPHSPQYCDFYKCIEAEIAFQTPERLLKAQSFWDNTISDFPLVIDFPFKNTLNNSSKCDYIYFNFPAEERALLKKFAFENHTTLFIVLAAIYSIQLSNYSNQNKLLISYPINTRPKGYANTFGCFVNNIPLKIDLEKKKTFLELVKEITEQRKLVKEFQWYSFSNLIRNLRNKNSKLGRNIFNIGFEETTLNSTQFNLNDLDVTPVDISCNETPYQFALLFDPTSENSIKFRVEYRQNEIDKNFVENFIHSFISYSKYVIKNPTDVIQEFSYQNPGEKKQVSKLLDKMYKFKSYNEIFSNSVINYRNNIAVCDKEKFLSYYELDLHTKKLNYILKKRGLSKGSIVGVVMERSHKFLITLLTIIRSGYVYLPILSEKNNLDSINNQLEIDIIIVDNFNRKNIKFEKVLNYEEINFSTSFKIFETPIYENDLTYIIFTSGSTGIPKGVKIHQAGFMNHIQAKIIDLDLTSNDIVAQTASQTFDISIWQFLSILLTGGKVSILPEKDEFQPEKTMKFLINQEITIYETIPTLLKYFLEFAEGNPELCKDIKIRTLMVTGEGCPIWLASKWFEVRNDIPIVNAYGPTECSDDVSHYKVNNSKELKSENYYLALGKPLPNFNFYVLNKNQQLLPIGIAGELYISGIGVGLGYVNEPEKTKDSFIPNIFPDGFKTLYKTGDLVKWDEGGNLHYLGRLDDQVKIRGIRIELGEIEATIKAHPLITYAIVLPHEEQNDTKILICFYMSEENINSDNLKVFLEKKLPSFKIPSFFIKINHIPLSAAGKADKFALLNLFINTRINSKNKEEIRAIPGDTLEQRLLFFWQMILENDYISLQDDFFTIGGHSLLAVKLLNKISKEFMLELPIDWVFSNLTISKQAHSLRNIDKEKIYAPVIYFQKPSKDKKNIYFIHPGGGSAIAYKNISDELIEHINIIGIESYHLYHKNDQYNTIEDLACFYKEKILEIHPENEPYYIAGWSLGGIFAYEIAQQLIKKNKKMGAVFMLDTFLPNQEERQTILTFEGIVFDILEENGFFMSLPEYYKDNVKNAIKLQTVACLQYIPCKIDIPVSMFKSTQSEKLKVSSQTETTLAFQNLMNSILVDNYNGWSKYAKNMEIHLIDGNHQSLVSTQRKKVAKIILDCLALTPPLV